MAEYILLHASMTSLVFATAAWEPYLGKACRRAARSKAVARSAMEFVFGSTEQFRR